MSDQQGEELSQDTTGIEPAVEPPRDFEDLTLSDALGQFWRAPLSTLRAVAAVAQTPTFTAPRHAANALPIFTPAPATPYPSIPRVIPSRPDTGETEPIRLVSEAEEFSLDKRVVLAQLVVRLVAFGLEIAGGVVMFRSMIRSEQTGLDLGLPYLLAGFFVWLLSELLPAIFDRQPRLPRMRPQARRHEATLVFSVSRLIAFAGAIVTSGLAWALNGGNTFTFFGVVAWLVSIVLWVWALAPEGWNPLTGLQIAGHWLSRTRVRFSWTLVMLVIIMGFGAYFRMVDLDANPPEMTSDHVEKLLDANRVFHGEYNVFFANNHGREPIQFYTLALLSNIPGLELNFHLLKLLTVIEGLITIPILFWMGKEVIGRDEPKLGNAVGLAIAALVAVSYWHEMLSRLGLRIVLTPLFTALVVIFLARGIRYNRRSDFLWAGVTLGFGVYAYQAIRMLPVAIVVAVVLAAIFWLRSLRERRHMLMNLAALAIVAIAVFVPLARYDWEYPIDFWRRTTGRLFGDQLTQTTDANGNLVARTPTAAELVEAFNQNIPAFVDNFRNAVLMYNWKGDVAWINNAPNTPAFDIITGALLILGVAAWLARMVRRRDPFDWSLIPLILIMMLPSALSIAYPIENPSATRMSGTLPGVYLLAALPLALLVLALPRLLGRVGTALAVAGAAAVVLVSYSLNQKTYFEDYRASYIANSLPYSVGGEQLRQFASTEGYGNAFILAYPYWWDHRALGIDAGRIDWGNTITKLDEIPMTLSQAVQRKDDLRLDPTKDLLFFYSTQDTLAQQWLQTNFPMGYWQTMTTYQPGHDFNMYRIPALGVDAFAYFLQRYGLSRP